MADLMLRADHGGDDSRRRWREPPLSLLRYEPDVRRLTRLVFGDHYIYDDSTGQLVPATRASAFAQSRWSGHPSGSVDAM